MPRFHDSTLRLALPFLLAGASLLAACGGSDSGSSTSSSSGSGSTSSSGGSSSSCSYPDLVTSAERNKARTCAGVQSSSVFDQADNGLASVIAACQAGQKAKADEYYNSTYKQMVSFARQNLATVCR